ncbi:uncharacterized protein LOC124293249 [Neodiprion lecontei]|uniref:Regulatory protein zeste n=1 Tax=Neodiprion lecontei TaxID=441921 RepID=A0ABM3FN27_NEOLC|nr:uncharacterized protein LOC124293249 [Neodiprion lecontei]
MASKRIRSGRATDAQLVAMVQFIETHKGIAEGKFLIMNGKEELRKKWDQLANTLNMTKGATKTTAQWQVTWRDMKSRTSQKARKIRNQRNATGNKEIDEVPLTPLELRVSGIIDKNYVERSSDCPDSVPEEEELQEQLAASDSSPLLKPPRVVSIFDHIASTSVAPRPGLTTPAPGGDTIQAPTRRRKQQLVPHADFTDTSIPG